MSRVYDNWERLVVAVLKEEELKRIAFCESISSSISADFSSRFSFASSLEDVPAASRIYGETFDPTANSSHHGVQPIKFEDLKFATRNFHRHSWLGEGGFGRVFKGWIDENTLSASKCGIGMVVAVKIRHPESWSGHQEWLKEINYLSQLRHPNLVKLIGYCSEENNQILVYEFMPKGSLDDHLFGRWRQSLSWATRIKVAIGAARGLSFLHDLATIVKLGGCQSSNSFLHDLATPVMHGGCRSSNIFLDWGFNAKLDFGLAWGGPPVYMTDISTETERPYDIVVPENGMTGSWVGISSPFGNPVSTEIEGPYGIVVPKYDMTDHFTTKCDDVYGFGIILLELLSGRRALDRDQPMKEHDLVEWAKLYLGNKRNLLQIMDTKLGGHYPHKGAYTVAKLALQCISSNPKLRPRMAEVLVALEQLECPDG